MDRYKILEGRNVLITGASGGIGQEIARDLAHKKCNLFLTSRSYGKLSDLKQELNQYVNIKILNINLSNIGLLNDLLTIVEETFYKLDIIINCAGIFKYKHSTDITTKDYEEMFNVNIKAPILICQRFIQKMIKNNWGRIINLGSSASYSGSKNTSLYSASKHAILGYSRALNKELKEHNVRTFCISPGSSQTEMAKISTDQDYTTFINPKEIAEYISFIISFNNELISDEIRLNRMEYK